MFFPQRITKIKESDSVLEIGPGADPHPRSNILLELEYENEEDYARQFGHDRKLETEKKVVFYDGKKFPFKDKEFDYVICAHVLEHVEDVEFFLSEIFRVAKRGYLEYPLAYYEYLYNFDVHLNFVKFDDGILKYMKKSESHLQEFKPIQDFLFQSLIKGHSKIIDDLIIYFMEGFEWEKPFAVRHVSTIADVCHKQIDLPRVTERPLHTFGPKRLLKELLRSVKLRGKY